MTSDLERIKFNLKIDGDYDKLKVTSKIILAANQAIKDGCTLNAWQWNIIWDKIDKCYKPTTGYYKYGTILSSIILYANDIIEAQKPKSELAAELLGIKYEWIIGFLAGLDGRYTNKVNKIIKRKSAIGQQCRDGLEIGKLLKIGYLSDIIVQLNFLPYDKINYNTHKWVDIDENIILLSMGAIQNNKILKCSECEMFGGIALDYFNKTNAYYISNKLLGDKYHRNIEKCNLNCNEIVIKKIIE